VPRFEVLVTFEPAVTTTPPVDNVVTGPLGATGVELDPRESPARSSERRTAASRSFGSTGACAAPAPRSRVTSSAIARIDAPRARSCGNSVSSLRVPSAAGSHKAT